MCFVQSDTLSSSEFLRVRSSCNTVHHECLQLFLDDISLELFGELLLMDFHKLVSAFQLMLELLQVVRVLLCLVPIVC